MKTFLRPLLPALAALLIPLSSFADTQVGNGIEIYTVPTGTATNQRFFVSQTQIVSAPPNDCAPRRRRSCKSDKSLMDNRRKGDSFGLWTIVSVLFSGAASAVFSFVAAKRLSSHNSRIVARALIHAFREECELGCKIIDAAKNKTQDTVLFLPSRVWETFKDKLSEGVLVELLRLARKAGRTSLGFPPEEFLLHMGRYFSYIVPNINRILETKDDDFGALPEAAHGVLAMLNTLEKQLH